MKARTRRRAPRAIFAAAAAAAAVALVAPAAASASSTLTVTLQGEAKQGQVATFVASGTNSNPESGSNYLFIYVKDARVDPTCAPTQEQESQTFMNNVFEPATAGAYDTIATGQLESYGPGSFNFQIKKAFSTPGPRLLCAYSTFIAVTTVATQLTVDVAPASAGGGTTTPGSGTGSPPDPGTTPEQGDDGPDTVTKPANRSRPRVSRNGRRLSCQRGTWTNATSYRYAWVVKNKTKRGAGRRTLTVSRRFRGTVKCRVTAFNAAGRTTALSRPYRVR